MFGTHARLFKVDQVARALGLCAGTVYRRVEAGELGALRLGSGPKAPVRIPSEELGKFLARGRRQ